MTRKGASGKNLKSLHTRFSSRISPKKGRYQSPGSADVQKKRSDMANHAKKLQKVPSYLGIEPFVIVSPLPLNLYNVCPYLESPDSTQS